MVIIFFTRISKKHYAKWLRYSWSVGQNSVLQGCGRIHFSLTWTLNLFAKKQKGEQNPSLLQVL